MPITNGLYKIDFGTKLGLGGGVVHLQDGNLFGGDSAMFYRGNYTDAEGKFSAKIRVGKHNDVGFSLFGVDEFWLEIQGTYEGKKLLAQGTSPQAPGIIIACLIEWITN